MPIYLRKIEDALLTDGSDAYFTYSGKKCGISLEVDEGTTMFTVWYGDQYHKHDSFNSAIYDKLFDGKSVADLVASGLVDPYYD